MTQDNNALAQELEALAKLATPDTLMNYGEPEVGMRTEPFFGEPLKGNMRPLADWTAHDAELVIKLWNNLPAILSALRQPTPASGEVGDLRQAIAAWMATNSLTPHHKVLAAGNRLYVAGEKAADMLERLGGASPEEHFLTAHVSEDGSVVGIDHSMNADWHAVRTAHIALRDRINERLETEDNCPFKPTQQPGDQVGRVARALAGHFGPEYDHCPTDRADLRQQVAEGRMVDCNATTQEDLKEAARAAIAAMPSGEVGQWLGIESAPRNKAVLLGWQDWRDGRWSMAVDAYSTGQRFANGYSTVSNHGSATHWMPLPAPPAQGEG